MRGWKDKACDCCDDSEYIRVSFESSLSCWGREIKPIQTKKLNTPEDEPNCSNESIFFQATQHVVEPSPSPLLSLSDSSRALI